MALNHSYEAIGRDFVQQYYAVFDSIVHRPALASMYNPATSFMTFEGVHIRGTVKIMERINNLPFQKINRIITSVDPQPMFDGSILISVLGRLQCDEDPPNLFNQVFILKPEVNGFYIANDIFRLGFHDTMQNIVL